jgi:uncharacterized phage protein (TIGR02216 family)
MRGPVARAARTDPARAGVSELFAAGAERLAGLIPRLLGWRPADFWDATPAELAAILVTPEGPAEAPLGREELNDLLERERDG